MIKDLSEDKLVNEDTILNDTFSMPLKQNNHTHFYNKKGIFESASRLATSSVAKSPSNYSLLRYSELHFKDNHDIGEKENN